MKQVQSQTIEQPGSTFSALRYLFRLIKLQTHQTQSSKSFNILQILTAEHVIGPQSFSSLLKQPTVYIYLYKPKRQRVEQ